MDYPISRTAELGLVGGKFTDGVPGVSVSSIDPSQTYNDLIDEILAVQAAAGVVKNEFVRTQLRDAIIKLIEARVGDYALDTGVANAYVVAMNPPIAAYTASFDVKFRVAHANTDATTLDAGGGPKALKNDVGGALVPGDLPLGFIVTATYDPPSDAFLINSLVPSQSMTQAQADARYANLNRTGNAGPIGYRNRVINGNFGVNQRGYVSGAALAAGAYGHDRWKAGGGGATYTFVQGKSSTNITVTAGTIQQIIEDTNIEGGSYTLSWSGSAQASINGGAFANSPITVNGLAADTSVTVAFGLGTVGLVQFEAGSVVTPFERRDSSEELRRCRYYFRPIPAGSHRSDQYSGASGSYYLSYMMEPMRATPTVTQPTFAYTNASSAAFTVNSRSDYTLSFAAGTGFYSVQTTAPGSFSAEL